MILQLCEGIAYVFDRQGTRELQVGGVVLLPPESAAVLTASVLERARFRGATLRVSSLTGFLTGLERQCLEADIARATAPFVLLPPDHAAAVQLGGLFANEKPSLANRVGFVQWFAELIGPQLNDALAKRHADQASQKQAKARLRQFITEMPESEFTDLSLGEMARMLHCCEHHASRLFRQEFGASFPSYVADLRLKKACQLLAYGQMKIIDVALESGHGSLAHFHYVFKKRYRVTPAEWRERRQPAEPRPVRARALQLAALAVCLLLAATGLCRAEGTVNTNGAASATASAKGAPPLLTFKVDRYDVTGNTVLTSNVLASTLAPFTGDAVSISTITNAMAALQLEYFHRGYVTVKVSAPPQQVTNRVIFFDVTEGRLAVVKILHNHYYSSNNIIRALPYVKTLESGQRILNSKIFQTELDAANANPDRQIAPEVRPGPDPGTTALVLDVKDRIPLHGRVEFDDFSPPGTPDLRLNGNAVYGNLWQLDHSLGIQYGFSPQGMKKSIGPDTDLGLDPLDAPQVSYYSAFYRAPLGSPQGVETQISQDPTHFGYNETTRQFVPPPATGNPELTAYASRSTTGPTLYGPVSTVLQTTSETIQSQLIQQQYTAQTIAGGKLSFPIPPLEGMQSSWNIGMEYKDDTVNTLPTNYFYSTTIVTHGNASAPPTVSRSTTAIPGTATFPHLSYVPFSLGWTGSRQDHWAQDSALDRFSEFDAGVTLVAGTGGTLFKNEQFPTLIGNSPNATKEFLAIRPEISRTQVLPDNFTVYVGLSGQWASEPLLNLEQFALGGNGSVRGYREGEYYGDNGWAGQTEIRTPIFWRGASALKIGTQATAFMDYGQAWLIDPLPGQASQQHLWGAGVGLNFNFGAYVESHILLGWPLIDGPDSRAGRNRVYFSLSAKL
jgi:hemolysin activation/secretion protein/AraC-like DNA-binding protein